MKAGMCGLTMSATLWAASCMDFVPGFADVYLLSVGFSTPLRIYARVLDPARLGELRDPALRGSDLRDLAECACPAREDSSHVEDRAERVVVELVLELTDMPVEEGAPVLPGRLANRLDGPDGMLDQAARVR
jgi:hypothetical protein